MSTSDYSKTPLASKLGIRKGFTIKVFNPPIPYIEFFAFLPENIHIEENPDKPEPADLIHIFCQREEELDRSFRMAITMLKKEGILWISWPKKSSGISTEIDKMYVLHYGQQKGLVDVKVASIDENWSAHKFVYRRRER